VVFCCCWTRGILVTLFGPCHDKSNVEGTGGREEERRGAERRSKWK
jgi:hypothetical protein